MRGGRAAACGTSDRTGAFAEKVMALASEGARVSLLARGQAWVVKRIEALLAKELDPETRAFLVEMREEHLENVEACHRRAEELGGTWRSGRRQACPE